MGNLNEPGRAVASLSCAGGETDHSDAGSKGLTLLSQQLHVRVPRADCPDCVTYQKKKKEWRGQGGSFLGLLLENLGLFGAVGIDASSYY